MFDRYAESISILASLVTLSGLAAIPIWGWSRWIKQPKVSGACPKMSAAGLVLASVSVIVGVAGFMRSIANPVMLYFDPVLQTMAGIGMLSAFLGALLSVFGVWRPSPVRWHALSASFIMLILWFGTAMSM